jgi:cytochrome c oxidase assembly protein subunit 15
MSPPRYHPRLHAFAIATVVVMLTTLSAGALVTSKNAGMAFRDWPTSDGQGMLSYPWWQDLGHDGKKFLEHGHRLAGVLIGCWVIALVGLVGWLEERTWVKGLAGGLLAAVVVQGILGGVRVWLDERGLAFVHGFFAACVTSLLAGLVTVLSRGWFTAAERFSTARIGLALPLAIGTAVLLVLQYLLGGMIRHHGTGLHEHLGLGLMSAAAALASAVAAHRTEVGWLRATGWGLVLAVLVQIGLGAATWIARWGYAPTGYVATADSIGQVALRTGHMVFGIFVLASAVVHVLRVGRVAAAARSGEMGATLSSPLTARGGVS